MSSTTSQPPASNPGHDDPSAGIQTGGGVSGAAQIETPVSNDLKDGGEPVHAEDKRPAPNAATTTGAGAQQPGGTYLSYRGDDGQQNTLSTSASRSGDSTSSATPTDPSTTTTSSATSKQTPTDNIQESASKGSSDQTTSTDKPSDSKDGDSEHTSAKGKGPQTGNVENVDSIPTAGGERLGDKHWGESKIVPEDPGKNAGVSDEGGNSAEVRDNTAKNTGGATGGPGHEGKDKEDGEQKEGLMDKVKDKLNIGKK